MTDNTQQQGGLLAVEVALQSIIDLNNDGEGARSFVAQRGCIARMKAIARDGMNALRLASVSSASAEIDALRHKLWMVACHATGGGIPEIEGIERSTNDICVQITAFRNKMYQAGKDAASPEPVPATNQAGEVEREAIAISADDREDARKYIAGRCDAAEERGDRAITVNIPALRLALSEPAPATDRAGEAEGRFWLIVHKPGNVPDRKGSWPIADMAKVLREFIAARPDSYLHVLTVDRYGVPEIQHGPEALQMSDGRSVGVGRKHNARTLAAHTEAACTCGSPYYDVGAHLSTCPASLATQPATSQEGEGYSREWCMNMAALEGNAEISAGALDHPLRTATPTPPTLSEDLREMHAGSFADEIEASGKAPWHGDQPIEEMAKNWKGRQWVPLDAAISALQFWQRRDFENGNLVHAIAKMKEALRPLATSVLADPETASGWRVGYNITLDHQHTAHLAYFGKPTTLAELPDPALTLAQVQAS